MPADRLSEEEEMLAYHENSLRQLDFALEAFKAERQMQLEGPDDARPPAALNGVYEKQAAALRTRRGAAVRVRGRGCPAADTYSALLSLPSP
jgi:hypothetical protein